MGIVFEDLHEYDGDHTVYPVVNESVKAWRKCLDGIKVKRAASVCSGGEVTFFGILPSVTGTLDAIDHSYKSLYFALGKYHLIEKLGTKEAFKALSENKRDELKTLFEEANADLPTGKKAALDKDKYAEHAKREEKAREAQLVNVKRGWERDREYYDGTYGKGYFEKNYGDWEAYKQRYLSSYGGYHRLYEWFGRWQGAQTQYKEVTQAGITEFRKNRDKVRFLHGDLNDLKERGPYDLVYLSNALDYMGRDNSYDFKVEEYVKPGGYLAYTSSGRHAGLLNARSASAYSSRREEYRSAKRTVGQFELVNQTGYRDSSLKGSYGSCWNYYLCKTPDEGSENEKAAAPSSDLAGAIF